ncbi:MAG: LacI family DNA-binding transcriptional regulator [Abditibacteriota bacterium]|nr:LacI family DNA-binding transcriptional regulator [Abditibacteriota bacterium]
MNKITLSEIAKKLNISVATVSRVMNQKTPITNDIHKEIIRLAKEGGYLQNPLNGNIGNIGFALIGLLNETTNPIEYNLGYNTSSFYGRLTFGLEKPVNELNGNLLVKNFDKTPNIWKEIDNFINTGNLSGLVVSVNGEFNDIQKFNNLLPTVLINHYEGFTPFIDTVASSNFAGIKKVFDYLISLGHEKIALWKPSYKYIHDQNRLYSYYTCLDYYNISYKKIYCDYSEKTSVSILDRMDVEFQKYLKDKDKPTAIICTNDTFAYVLCQLAKKYNVRIPQDLSITGFDDLDIISMPTPRITSVNSHLSLMGKHAIHLLSKRINDNTREHIQITIEPELVIRDTVGKAQMTEKINFL